MACFRTKILFLFLMLLPSQSVFADCREQDALFRRAQGLFDSGQYLLSSFHFSQLSASPCDPELTIRAQFGYARSMAELGEIPESLRALSRLDESPNPVMRARVALFRGYLVPDEAGPMPEKLPEEPRWRLQLWYARDSASRFIALLQTAPREDASRVDLRAIGDELSKLPVKSPWIAGVSSTLLPGAGQAYVGAFQSAAISFVLNAIFLATTVELAQKNLPFTAVASGMVFSVTYIGNILNAVDAAHRTNANARAPVEARLQSTLLPELHP